MYQFDVDDARNVERDMRILRNAGVLVTAFFLGGYIGDRTGRVAGRQSVEAVACEPTIVGLRKNGKEIPLTSAQRDSLARAR